MTPSARPVDQAMGEMRPEKIIVRSLWAKEIKKTFAKHPKSEVPLYLTLAGASGLDIQYMIDEGIVKLTEVGAIAEKDRSKVIAVERDSKAVLDLQKKFPGLHIEEVDFKDVLSGEDLFLWPDPDREKICRALIVNLDLNCSLNDKEGKPVFPVLEWIKKLSLLHKKTPQNNWTLCLTLNALTNWSNKSYKWAKDFLKGNFERDLVFKSNCKDFFGEQLFDLLSDNQKLLFKDLDKLEQQKLLMVIVPKLIVQYVQNDGWEVTTEYNLCYGATTSGRAPMATWVIKFAYKGASKTPDSLYRTALVNILPGAGTVTQEGIESL